VLKYWKTNGIKDMRVVGEGLATDFISNEVVPTLFDVKKAKLKSDFTITMSSTKVITN